MIEKIEHRSVDSLRPYARNARTHSDEQVQKIAASIAEFGFNNPILVDARGGIIAGHGRLEAAKLLGMETVPVVELTHLTDSQKRAYILADNRLALDAGWDEEILAAELADLQIEDFDLDIIGFSDDELEGLLVAGEPILEGDQTRDVGNGGSGELRYQVVVDCDDESHQGRLMERLEKEGLTCRPLIL